MRIPHTDRGSRYAADAFLAMRRSRRIVESMARYGSRLDNAAAESFFTTRKTELVYRVV